MTDRGLQEQLERSRQAHAGTARLAAIRVRELEEQLESLRGALVKIADGPSEESPPEIARCALGWPSHGWESGVWGNLIPCPTCEGTGRKYPERKGDYRPVADIGCPECGGTGRVASSPATEPDA